MILICGDTHGEEKRLRFLAEHAHTVCPDRGEKKYLIICGDFGFDGRDGDFLQGLAQENGDLVWLFVDGNHENFDYLNGLPVDQWHGGNVHMLVRDKVIHLMRGEVFTIEGRRFFTFGGVFINARIFKNFCEDFSGFFKDYIHCVFFGECIFFLKLREPFGVFGKGFVGRNVFS